jgi:hypothetical protein
MSAVDPGAVNDLALPCPICRGNARKPDVDACLARPASGWRLSPCRRGSGLASLRTSLTSRSEVVGSTRRKENTSAAVEVEGSTTPTIALG